MPQPTSAPFSATRSIAKPRLLYAVVGVFLLAGTCPLQGQDTEYFKEVKRIRNIEKPLLDDFEEAEKDYRKGPKRVFDRIRLNGPKSPKEQKDLEDAVEFLIFSLTKPRLPEDELDELVRDLIKDIKDAGRNIGQPRGEERFRTKVFLPLVLEKLDKLLDNNFAVRTQVIRILMICDQFAERNKVASKPYSPARVALLKIANDQKQPSPIRSTAITGLMRHLRLSNPQGTASDEMQVARLIVSQLNGPNIQPAEAYQLLEHLTYIHYTFDPRGGAPIGLIAATKILIDKKQPLWLRLKAARTIGRTGEGPKSIQWTPFVYTFVELTLEFAEAHNAAKEPPEDHVIRVKNLMTAFHIENKSGVGANNGLLLRDGKTAVAAWKTAVSPVIKALLRSKKITPAQIKALKDWLKANRPANMKYSEKAPPLPEPAKAEKDPVPEG